MKLRNLILMLIVGANNYSPLHAESSLTISALPSYNLLKYKKNNVRSSGDFDLGFGITFRHKFSKKWQFAIGVNHRKYNGTINYNGMIDSVHLTDHSEGHNYFLYQIFNSTEKQSVTYIEPNIRLEYVQPLSSKIDFIGGLGLAYGINFSETNQMTIGSYRRYAWYYENHNLIDYMPSMNLDTYTNFLNPLPGKTFKHSLFALGEIGFRFRLSSNWSLITMLNAQHSLFNIQAKRDVFTNHWSYSGIAASEIPQGVRAISVGLEIGLSYRFENTPKRPQLRGVYCPY